MQTADQSWPAASDVIVRRHVLRNAAIPITTVVGLTIASLIALSAVVETAFGLNGLGSYLVQAAQNKDFAVVQGISLVLVVALRRGQHRSSTSPTPSSTRGSRSGAEPSEHPRRRCPAHRCGPGEPGPDAVPRQATRRRPRPAAGCPGSVWAAGSASAIIAVAVLLAIFGPIAAALRPERGRTSPMPTSARRVVTCSGFDGAGRDLLSRLMVGARTTLLGAALVSIVAVVDRLEPGRRSPPGSAAGSTPPSRAAST